MSGQAGRYDVGFSDDENQGRPRDRDAVEQLHRWASEAESADQLLGWSDPDPPGLFNRWRYEPRLWRRCALSVFQPPQFRFVHSEVFDARFDRPGSGSPVRNLVERRRTGPVGRLSDDPTELQAGCRVCEAFGHDAVRWRGVLEPADREQRHDSKPPDRKQVCNTSGVRVRASSKPGITGSRPGSSFRTAVPSSSRPGRRSSV